MNRPPATTEIPLSCRVVPLEQSRLATMGPHVLRLRIVRPMRGPAPVRLEHLQDDVLVGRTLHAMIYDIARIAAGCLGRGEHLLRCRPLDVEVAPFGEGPASVGPAVEVIVCLHEREGVLMEICLDGLGDQGSSADWIVDALVATSWSLLEASS